MRKPRFSAGIPALALSASIAILSVLPTQSLAQGPSLPGAPEQTPIDGGLGLLALAGGAFAYRRFVGSRDQDGSRRVD